MNSFLPLLKVQFLSLFGINKMAQRQKNKLFGVRGVLGVALIFAVVICAIAYFYTKIFAEAYLLLGKTQEFLPAVFALVCIICLVVSFYSSSSNLYGGKDFDLLGAMPIKTHTIVLSKIAFMYLADLIFGILIIVPAVFVHFELLGVVATIDLVRLGIMTLFLPIFPIIISLALGALVSFISTKFKRKSLVQSLLYSIVFLGCYALSLIDSNLVDSLAPFKKMYFLFPLVLNGMFSFKFTALFCGASALMFIVAFFVVEKTYNSLNTKLKAVKRTKNFKLGIYQQKSQFKVLLKKEFKLLFSAPIYAMNTLIGSLMVIVGSIALMIIALQTGSLEMTIMYAIIMQALFAFSLMISPTTAVSISVEGNTFYLMRTMPVSMKRLLNTKLFVNLLVGAIPAFIGSVVFSFALKGASVWFILLCILNSTLYSVLGGNLGLLFNLLFPMMKWDNITKPVKQSISLVLTILLGMAIAGGVFCLLFFVNLKLEILLLLIFILLLLLSTFTYWLIMRNGEKLIIKKT